MGFKINTGVKCRQVFFKQPCRYILNRSRGIHNFNLLIVLQSRNQRPSDFSIPKKDEEEKQIFRKTNTSGSGGGGTGGIIPPPDEGDE